MIANTHQSAPTVPWRGLSALVYRALKALHELFGLLVFIGGIAFLIFACYFFAAFRGGSMTPTGEQTARIADHSDVRYVKPAVAKDIRILQYVLLGTMGPGVAGALATNALAERLRTRYAPPEPAAPATIGA